MIAKEIEALLDVPNEGLIGLIGCVVSGRIGVFGVTAWIGGDEFNAGMSDRV